MLLKFLCLFFAGLATGIGSFAGLLYFMFLTDVVNHWFLSYARARRIVRWIVIIAALCAIVSASCGLIYYHA